MRVYRNVPLLIQRTVTNPLSPPCKRMVRIRFSLVLRHKYESVGCEGMQNGERQNAREWDGRSVGRELACQDSVAPHSPRHRQPLRRPATLRPIPRSILTSSAPAGTAAPGRTQLQGILGDDRDAVNWYCLDVTKLRNILFRMKIKNLCTMLCKIVIYTQRATAHRE